MKSRKQRLLNRCLGYSVLWKSRQRTKYLTRSVGPFKGGFTFRKMLQRGSSCFSLEPVSTMTTITGQFMSSPGPDSALHFRTISTSIIMVSLSVQKSPSDISTPQGDKIIKREPPIGSRKWSWKSARTNPSSNVLAHTDLRSACPPNYRCPADQRSHNLISPGRRLDRPRKPQFPQWQFPPLAIH